MLAKSYRINISEETLPLIAFLNGGVEPLIEEKPTQFLFTIDSPNEITTTKDAIQFEDDLYDENGHTKDEFYNYATLIG